MSAFSRREFNDAITFVSGCGFLGGLVTWLGASAWRLISGREVDLERWILNGAGIGGVAGGVGLLMDLIL